MKNQEIHRLFTIADKNGDGEIDWAEFLTVMKMTMKEERMKNNPETVKIVKPRKTARQVSWKENPPVVSRERKASSLNTQKKTEILRMFNRMDPNGNGFVEKKEFAFYMRNQGTPLPRDRVNYLYEEI